MQEDVIYDSANHRLLLQAYATSIGYDYVAVYSVDESTGAVTYVRNCVTQEGTGYHIPQGVCLIQGKCYKLVQATGSTQELRAINVSDGTVSVCAALPAMLTNATNENGLGIFPVEDKLYFFTSNTGINYIYNCTTNVWTSVTKDTANQASSGYAFKSMAMSTDPNTGVKTFVGLRSGTAKIDGLIFTGEVLPDGTLAILEDTNSNMTKIISKDLMYFKTGIKKAWIYKNGIYNPYPTYAGTGTNWQQI